MPAGYEGTRGQIAGEGGREAVGIAGFAFAFGSALVKVDVAAFPDSVGVI